MNRVGAHMRPTRRRLKIDSDSLAFPISIANGAEFLVMTGRLVDRVRLGRRRAFGKMRGRLHMRGALAVICSHGFKPFDCDAAGAIPYSRRACYLGGQGVERK